MPQAIPVIVKVVSAAVAAVKAYGVVKTIMLVAAVAYSYTSAQKAKKKARELASAFAGMESSLQNWVSTSATANIIIGKTRVGGPIVHMSTSGEKNKYLHLVVNLAGHEIESIEQIYLDDKKVWDSTGFITSYYNGLVVNRKLLGTADQTADSFMVSNIPSWTSNHRLQGLACLYIRLEYDEEKVTSIPTVTAVCKGLKCYDPRDAVTGSFTNEAVSGSNEIIFDYNPSNDVQVVFDTDGVLPSPLETNTRYWLHQTTTASSSFYYDELNQEPILFEDTGSGNHSIISLEKSWTDTPSLIVTELLTRFFDVLHNEIDWDSVIDAANIDEETVTLPDATTQKRYTCDGVMNTDLPLLDMVNYVLTSNAGNISYRGGIFKIFSGAHKTATTTITENDLIDYISFNTAKSRRDSFNTAKGMYLNPDDDVYSGTDFTPFTVDAYVDQDNGESRILELEFPFTTDHNRARRLAKIELLKNRLQELSISMKTNAKMLTVQSGDVIQFDLPRYNWNNKEFEVANISYNLESNGVSTNLELVETTASIWEWAEEDDDFAYTGSIPDYGSNLTGSITGQSAVTSYLVSSDKSVTPRAKLTWNLPENIIVKEVEMQYRISGSNNYTSSILDGTSETFFYTDVEVGESYQFRARTLSIFDRYSGYSQFNDLTISEYDYGPVAAPLPITASTENQTYTITWNEGNDLHPLDYYNVYIYSSNTPSNAVLIGSTKDTKFVYQSPYPEVQRYFWMEKVSITGETSSFSSPYTRKICGWDMEGTTVVDHSGIVMYDPPTGSFDVYGFRRGARISPHKDHEWDVVESQSLLISPRTWTMRVENNSDDDISVYSQYQVVQPDGNFWNNQTVRQVDVASHSVGFMTITTTSKVGASNIATGSNWTYRSYIRAWTDPFLTEVNNVTCSLQDVKTFVKVYDTPEGNF